MESTHDVPARTDHATPRPRSTSRRRRALALAPVLGAFGSLAALTPATPAQAVDNWGVKEVNFSPHLCDVAVDLFCDDTSGPGVLQVEQSEVADGVWEFSDLTTGSVAGDGYVHVQANFGGKCKTNYRLDSASVGLGIEEDDWNDNSPATVYADPPWSQSFGVNEENMTFQNRIANLFIPIEELFEPSFDGTAGNYMTGSFDSVEDIIAYGEAEVAARVAAGEDEVDVRSEGFTIERQIKTHATLGCKKLMFGDKVWFKSTFAYLPLTIRFGGDDAFREAHLDFDQPEQPDPVAPIEPEYTLGAAVTQATMDVQYDEADPCRLWLTGAVTTTAPTELSYRIVDELGVKSQIFTTQIDHTQTYIYRHEIEIPAAVVVHDAERGADDLTATPDDGGIDGYSSVTNENVSGTYHLEIIIPHGYESNIDGYNVPPCGSAPSGETEPIVMLDPDNPLGEGTDDTSFEELPDGTTRET